MTGVDQNQLFAAIRERDEAWAEVARLQRLVAGGAISNSDSEGSATRDHNPHLQLVKTNVGSWHHCAKRFFDAAIIGIAFALARAGWTRCSAFRDSCRSEIRCVSYKIELASAFRVPHSHGMPPAG